ncbi:hypothetical protein BJF89_00935 [Corynebacterium sp. CNJ-954]|uniref:hypothetical protein n=1 Tax=Corynebacterium sp. CNJ-954 TaxID=1904962 RepID=UPI0009652916|nr:hypothetical protein [Corynebacterium sp. CNJ-954]OLT54829.1 hypothetical protein BJF89_00935 [Corynebacterium sp. CNJ-954]
MGISPDRYTPSWDGSPQDLKSLGNAGNDLGSGLAESFQGTVGGIGTAISNALNGILTGGPFAPVEEAAEEIRNGQLDLTDRVDLLFGISGYGFSYMSKNINAQWSTNNTRRMRFDKQLGPAKNTSITSDGRLSLDGAGAWLVLVKTHAAGTTFGGNAMIRQTVRIRRPNGTFYHTCIDDASTFSEGGFVTDPKGAGTLLSIFPVVIEEPGCKVEVDTWTGAWRWWDGGTRFSMMAAIRHSTDTQNRGDEVVPNETEEEANK